MHIADDQYIACMRLELSAPDGSTQVVEAGAPVEGFEAWPFVVKDALLRLGRVKKHGLLYKGNLSVQGGYLHFETADEVAAQQAARPPVSEAQSLAPVKRGRGRPPKAATL